jgi:predicted transcriptional regulator
MDEMATSKLKPTQRKTAKKTPTSPAPKETSRWTFLTNHAHVLILLSTDPSMVLREVASIVGITERAVQRIISDLVDDGFLQRDKVGRNNHYRILTKQPLRHRIEAHRTIGDLVAFVKHS